MKIIITGAKGQLGSQVFNILKNKKSDLGKIDSTYFKADITCLDLDELDISDFTKVKKYINDIKPKILINCAAYTNVDGCENNEELAFRVNSLGAKNLAIACEEVGAKLIHISTDYVFEGKGQIPYREYDLPNPVSIYGKSKYLGEEYVKQFCNKYFIVRTAWLYGYNGNNFVKTIIRVGKDKGHIDVVDDQRGNPTNAEDLAYHILKLAVTEEYGVYHCTGNGECSWYDFACEIIRYSNINCTVSPITSNKLSRIAKRPSYSSLDNMMLRCTVGDEMREWKGALKKFIENVQL